MSGVGWIGLGAMGAPMAACAARAGFAVAAFDIDPRQAAAVAGDGVVAAGSAAEAAAGADLLVLMVAAPEQAEAVLFGEGGAAAALDAGAVVVVMSTVGPAAVTGWKSRLAQFEIALVDAPVSGGVARAGAGDLLRSVQLHRRGCAEADRESRGPHQCADRRTRSAIGARHARGR